MISRFGVVPGKGNRILVSFVFLSIPASGLAVDCREVLGEWRWFVGGTVVFSEDHSAKFTPDPSVPLPHGKGQWTCDAQSGTYTVDWSNNFIDTLTISEDGARISGTNMAGQAIWGTRPGAPAPKADCSQASDVLGQGACALLSAADLCQTLGQPFSPGKSARARRLDTCSFRSVDGRGDQVQITSSTSGSLDNFNKLKALKKTAIDLPEVGPNAYAVLDVHGKRLTAHLWHGNRSLRLKMKGFSALSRPWNREEKISQATALCKKAVQRVGAGSVPDLRDLLPLGSP